MKNTFTLLLLTTLISACSSIDVKKEEVRKINKVAVVGFELIQELPNEVTLSLGGTSSADSNVAMMGEPAIPHQHPAISMMYQALNRKLKKSLKWQVEGLKDLEANEYYQSIFKSKMTGWKSRAMIPKGTKLYTLKNMLDGFSVMTLKPEERKALARKLNVDAIVVAALETKLVSKASWASLVGGGKFTPQVKSRFYVYSSHTGEAIWSDVNAMGKESTKRIGHWAGIADLEKLIKASLESANDSYAQVISRYEQF
ncbi:MAG: hypothetical protein KDD50_15565 [Bdellovibrionales bacterium]|nr:hypothetical protein [Bdellovibrionales bacterium]